MQIRASTALRNEYLQISQLAKVSGEPIYITNKGEADLVIQSIENGMSEDFFSIDLQNAYASLGRMIGEEVEDDLVEEIFSRFCLGK